MWKRCGISVLGGIITSCLLTGWTAAPASVRSLKLTILYDNTAAAAVCRADWGFACLVEGPEKTILWDTGAKAEVFAANAAALNVNYAGIGAIAISHTHGDHLAGLLPSLRSMKGVPVFLPHSSARSLIDAVTEAGGTVRSSKEPVEICSDVLLSGEMGAQIREQSLIVRTARGIVVLTGCSHPGIVAILERAREVGKQNIHAVVGGFHLLEHSEAAVRDIVSRFKELGVAKVAATHCTGPRAIEAFRKAYGTDFIEAGAGRTIEFR